MGLSYPTLMGLCSVTQVGTFLTCVRYLMKYISLFVHCLGNVSCQFKLFDVKEH